MATIVPTISFPHQNAVKFEWANLARYEEVAFTSGSGDVDVGDTLTKGAVTATIDAVTITSGSLGAGTAAGSLKISARAGGNFSAGAATTTGAGAVTLSGAETITEDVGTAVPPNWADYVDRNVQVKGTAGAGFSLLVEGGRDGSTFATLNDAVGTALNFTAVGVKQVQEMPLYTRPRIDDGQTDTTNVTVIMVARRERGAQGI